MNFIDDNIISARFNVHRDYTHGHDKDPRVHLRCAVQLASAKKIITLDDDVGG